MDWNVYQIGWVVTYTLIAFFTCSERDRWSNYSDAKRPLFIGFTLLLAATMISCLVKNRWVWDYVADVLLLRKVNGYFLLMMIGLAYALVIFGLGIITTIFSKSDKEDKTDRE